jgi:hypothetical protein
MDDAWLGSGGPAAYRRAMVSFMLAVRREASGRQSLPGKSTNKPRAHTFESSSRFERREESLGMWGGGLEVAKSQRG